MKYGRWTVIEIERRREKSGRLRPIAHCVCDCGRTKDVAFDNLVSGKSASCGCLMRELGAKRQFKHGGVGLPEYKCWQLLKNRCTNPRSRDYKNYGGRGIRVCDRWLNSFADFLESVGARPSVNHSIDRIDNSRGYEPGNCRWATGSEQARNKRNNALNLETADRIRDMYRGGIGPTQIAKTFRKPIGTVANVIYGSSWK